MIRKELAELADRLDITGRSKMARDELEAAIRGAHRGPGTATAS
jgi:hypothetical protein